VSAYVIIDIDVVDLTGFDEYRNNVVELVEKCGGKYIVASNEIDTLEGSWEPKRLVIIQFDSAEAAKAWLSCDEYRDLREVRHRTANTNMILVQATG